MNLKFLQFDEDTWNILDTDTDMLIGKIHVERDEYINQMVPDDLIDTCHDYQAYHRIALRGQAVSATKIDPWAPLGSWRVTDVTFGATGQAVIEL